MLRESRPHLCSQLRIARAAAESALLIVSTRTQRDARREDESRYTGSIRPLHPEGATAALRANGIGGSRRTIVSFVPPPTLLSRVSSAPISYACSRNPMMPK